MEPSLQLVSLLLASIILPLGYCWVCRAMRVRRVPNPPRLGLFFVFGTLGGWALVFAVPSYGLIATCVAALVTAAPLALLLSAIDLWSRPERTTFHRIAIWGGFGYCAILALRIVASIVEA